MSLERMRRVEELFGELLALDAPHRERVLLQKCAGDEDLAGELRRMLAVMDHTQGPLDKLPTAIAALTPPPGGFGAPTVGLPAGTRVAGYQIVGVLGEGGMGVVYRAQQLRPKREVALKLIRPGLATASLLRRFEFEAEVLGRLQHPGIAQIIEAGTFEGVIGAGGGPQPFFAMELVEGRTLIDYCNTAHLGQRERLELMRRVCDAVEHAHQRGVIHRDLKPGNILVTAQGQPKILDFGVARAVESGAAAGGPGGATDPRITIIATGERPLIGTLAYMSPEQVEGDPTQIDTRTDVYALGVILYQLVSGRLPHDLSGKNLPDALKTVTDTDAPSLSAVISSARGDLETVATKALEKDKARRYQSAAALSEDLRRFLNSEPIAARPASTWYQARKFARRHRALVAGRSVAVLALVAGLIATALGLAEATRQRDAANAALERQRQTASFLKDVLRGIDPEVARGRDNYVLSRMLGDWSKKLDAGARLHPEDEFELRLLVGDVHEKLSQLQPAEDMARKALALAEARWGKESAQTGEALNALGSAVADLRSYAEGEQILRRALEIRERLHGPESPEVAATLSNLVFTTRRQGHEDQSRPLAERLVAIRAKNPGTGTREYLDAQDALASTLIIQGETQRAIKLMEEALASARALFGPDHPSLVRFLLDMGIIYYRAERPADARKAQEEALALADRLIAGDWVTKADILDSLCNVCSDLGDDAAFDSYVARSIDMKKRLFGEQSSEVLQSHYNLGSMLRNRGKLAEAEHQAAVAIEIGRKVAPDSPDFRDALYLRGNVLQAMKRESEAEPVLRELLATERRVTAPGSPDPIMTGQALATVLSEQAWKLVEPGAAPGAAPSPEAAERADEANRLYAEAAQYFGQRNGPDHPRTALARLSICATRALAALARRDASVSGSELASDAQSLFDKLWDARDALPVASRTRVLQSAAKAVARVHGVLDRLEPGKGHDTDEKRWTARITEIPAQLTQPQDAKGAR